MISKPSRYETKNHLQAEQRIWWLISGKVVWFEIRGLHTAATSRKWCSQRDVDERLVAAWRGLLEIYIGENRSGRYSIFCLDWREYRMEKMSFYICMFARVEESESIHNCQNFWGIFFSQRKWFFTQKWFCIRFEQIVLGLRNRSV